MFEWIEEIRQKVEQIGGHRVLDLSRKGASEKEILQVEEHLQILLPLSHKEFIRRWNGGQLAGSRLLSTGEIIEFAENVTNDSRQNHYYTGKPDYLIVFRTFDLGSDVFCFDTSRTTYGENPVCRYDAENEMEKNLQIRFPSFEAMMISEILDLVGDGGVYEDFMDEADEDELMEIENYFADWEARLTEMLETRGADLSDRLFPNWSNWK